MKNKIVYLDYKKLIDKMAWSFSKKMNMEFEELQAEGNLEYCLCVERFNPDMNIKFCTYLHNCLRNKFVTICSKEMKKMIHTEEMPLTCIQIPGNQYKRALFISLFLKNKDKAVRSITQIILTEKPPKDKPIRQGWILPTLYQKYGFTAREAKKGLALFSELMAAF